MNAALLSGGLVGLSLGLTGGGGAIFAVPLLVYWIGVDPRTAVSISLVTVAVTAFVGAIERWRYGQVELSTGFLFAASGMVAAPLGGWLGTLIPEPLLLTAFAALMLLIAARMWAKASDPTERASPARQAWPAKPPRAGPFRPISPVASSPAVSPGSWPDRSSAAGSPGRCSRRSSLRRLCSWRCSSLPRRSSRSDPFCVPGEPAHKPS